MNLDEKDIFIFPNLWYITFPSIMIVGKTTDIVTLLAIK